MVLKSVNSYQASFLISNEELIKNGCNIEHGITQATIEKITDEILHQLSAQTDLCMDNVGFSVEMFKANSNEFVCVVTSISKYLKYRGEQQKEEDRGYALRTEPLILCRSTDINIIIRLCHRLHHWLANGRTDVVNPMLFKFPVKSNLYNTNKEYQIVISEVTDMDNREELIAIVGEYCYVNSVSELYEAYLGEHGKCLVTGHAIQQMSELY